METTVTSQSNERSSSPQDAKAHSKRAFYKDCHKCPRNGTGDPFCWKTCRGPAEYSNKGQSFVTLGAFALEEEGDFIHAKIDADKRKDMDNHDIGFVFFDEEADSAPETVTATLTEDTERNMTVVIASLFALPDIQLCILKHLLFGEDYATIGRTLPKPMSKEAVHKHIQRMKGSCHFFASIMKQMQIKGTGGATRRKPYNLELDLG